MVLRFAQSLLSTFDTPLGLNKKSWFSKFNFVKKLSNLEFQKGGNAAETTQCLMNVHNLFAWQASCWPSLPRLAQACLSLARLAQAWSNFDFSKQAMQHQL